MKLMGPQEQVLVAVLHVRFFFFLRAVSFVLGEVPKLLLYTAIASTLVGTIGIASECCFGRTIGIQKCILDTITLTVKLETP